MMSFKDFKSFNVEDIEDTAKEKIVGFFDFIRTQGVFGLAIGFMLGDKIKNLVNSFVFDIVTPLTSALTGSASNLADSKINLFGVDIFWGNFTATLVDFLLMAFIVYFIFKGFGLDKLDKPKN
jgi:large conductance mechanosensitive channel